VRLQLQSPEKRAIAAAAAAMVGDGESVALDSSTTAYYLALELRKKREIVVVTNGLLNAVALADSPGVNVLVTGGMFRLPAMSVVGDPAGDVLRSTRIDKGFVGVRGISIDRGLLDLNPEEVQIKREMTAACEKVIAIFDSTKWHRSALLSFLPAGRLDAIITDVGAPDDVVQAWRSRGVEVTTADPEHALRHSERLPGLRPKTDGASSLRRDA
jgi:DeoR/GlpR family transcriptional regulator of sugar metabolism